MSLNFVYPKENTYFSYIDCKKLRSVLNHLNVQIIEVPKCDPLKKNLKYDETLAMVQLFKIQCRYLAGNQNNILMHSEYFAMEHGYIHLLSSI